MQNGILKFLRYPIISDYLKSFLHLFYPHICLQCGIDQLDDRHVLCNTCESQLPFTHFALMQNSPVEKIFWGRVKIQNVISVLFFTKDSIVQTILFELKYKQNKKAGYLFGRLIAYELIKNYKFGSIDYLIPIPISNKRLRKRGFNQSQVICEAIVDAGFEAPIFKGFYKIKDTQTQTHKDRLQRSNNINSMFYLKAPQLLKNKHILIIDDVLTTGATMESAINCLFQYNPASIHIATAAYTLH
jgi:ComF family protein